MADLAFGAQYLGLRLRAHELLRDVPLYDVSAVDLPGGGSGRSIADIRVLDSSTPPSRIAVVLYGARYFLGRVFGWDRRAIRSEETLVPSLSERDRRESGHAHEKIDGRGLGVLSRIIEYLHDEGVHSQRIDYSDSRALLRRIRDASVINTEKYQATRPK